MVGFDLVGYTVSLFFEVGRSKAQNREEYILYKAIHIKVCVHPIVDQNGVFYTQFNHI